MFQKLKDGANKLKAKIGGDELDEKLVEVVSEENWQASTHQLHEIANAAYNYEKWQRINQFIWEKLKKSKSWKKILKTFNLIEFLLKNGPPSIISNFKYDLYQLRVFESYSNYVDGVDKGEPIRQRAKAVVALLSNEEQLEEERLKAKNIREKMSNIVGGSSYNGGGGGSGGNSGYGGYDNYGGSKYGQSKKKEKTDANNAYNYGNTVGHFGDYTYGKSTIDKYKDPKNDKPASGSTDQGKKEEKKPQIYVETKKPFEKIATKLSKPGEKKQVQQTVVETKNISSTTSTSAPNNNNIIEFDIMGSQPVKPIENSAPFSFDQSAPAISQPQPQPQVVQPQPPPQFVQPVQQIPQPQPIIQPTQQPQQIPQIPQHYNPYQQPYVHPGQQFVPQPQYHQQMMPGQPYGPQYGAYNQYGQPQPSYGMPHPNVPAQGMGVGMAGNQGYSPYVNPMYPTTAPMVANQMQNKGNLNTMQITLSTGKKQQQFGNFASSSEGTAQNVKWLSSTQKGLIDFSDFGSEIQKNSKPSNNKNVSNNIQIDNWSW